MSVARKVRRNNESNRREELLRVSARLFREKGFDGTTIRDISAAAGMHSGSPFYHFRTKQDILVAVMEQGLAEGLHRLELAMAQPLSPERRFIRMIRAQIGTILEDGNDFIPVLLYDFRSLSAANRRRIVDLKDRYDAPTYAVLKREVTRERVAQHFAATCKGPVEIYPLDNLLALKIVLNAALQGGAARSLRMDNLGKTVAAALLRMEIEAPADLPRLARA